MDYEGQDSFLDTRGDKKQPSVNRPVQVKTFNSIFVSKLHFKLNVWKYAFKSVLLFNLLFF